jgi:hypothetical protein
VPINVFVSVGRLFTPKQEAFVASVENHLANNGLRPRTVGRNEFTHKQPLQLVDELMDKSGGVLVIALERLSKGTFQSWYHDVRRRAGWFRYRR